MSAPDLKEIIEASRQHERLKAEVIAWMKSEGEGGRLRQNWHAPMWQAYEDSVERLEDLGDCITPLRHRVEALETDAQALRGVLKRASDLFNDIGLSEDDAARAAKGERICRAVLDSKNPGDDLVRQRDTLLASFETAVRIIEEAKPGSFDNGNAAYGTDEGDVLTHRWLSEARVLIEAVKTPK